MCDLMDLDSDSDFYGDHELTTRLQSRVDNFDIAQWHQDQQAAARFKREATKEPATPKTSKLHNPYAGVLYAWQLTETVEDFLQRLPPATTEATLERPWIFICNPYIPRRNKDEAQNQGSRGNEDEAPEEEGTQLMMLIEGGTERLHILKSFMEGAPRMGRSASAVARDVNAQKKKAVEDILGLAHACKVRAGKWMLFCHPHEVNEVWGVVAKATAKNELGIAAKVAPRSEDSGRRDRLICVYTTDFRDQADIARVLRRLRELRLLDAMGRRIYYKPDAFTYLGIASGNTWEVRASLYSSFDLLKSP